MNPSKINDLKEKAVKAAIHANDLTDKVIQASVQAERDKHNGHNEAVNTIGAGMVYVNGEPNWKTDDGDKSTDNEDNENAKTVEPFTGDDLKRRVDENYKKSGGR